MKMAYVSPKGPRKEYTQRIMEIRRSSAASPQKNRKAEAKRGRVKGSRRDNKAKAIKDQYV